MDPEVVAAITKKIQRQFPQVAHARPKIRQQTTPAGQKPGAPPVYLLTFQADAQGPQGIKIPQWVRVAATPQGKILKITTSKS